MRGVIVFPEGASRQYWYLHRVKEGRIDIRFFRDEALIGWRNVALHRHVSAVPGVSQLCVIGRGHSLHAGQRRHGVENTLVQQRNLLLRVTGEQWIDVKRD
jgi:hypothetical protein